MPMLLNSGLDQLKVVLGDGSFSNGNGQHCHYIAKRERGRQQKIYPVKYFLDSADGVGLMWTSNLKASDILQSHLTRVHGDEKKITVGERLETARIVG